MLSSHVAGEDFVFDDGSVTMNWSISSSLVRQAILSSRVSMNVMLSPQNLSTCGGALLSARQKLRRRQLFTSTICPRNAPSIFPARPFLHDHMKYRLLRAFHGSHVSYQAATPQPKAVPLSRLKDNFIDGTSSVFLEELQRMWEADPNSVDVTWQVFFKNFTGTSASSSPGLSLAGASNQVRSVLKSETCTFVSDYIY